MTLCETWRRLRLYKQSICLRLENEMPNIARGKNSLKLATLYETCIKYKHKKKTYIYENTWRKIYYKNDFI